LSNNMNYDIIALHQADSDMQKENLERFRKDNNKTEFLQRQTNIGLMFREAMEEALKTPNNLINT